MSRLPVANQALLGSWTADICQEGRSQRSPPQRRHTAHLRWHSRSTPRNQTAGTREVIRRTAHLGQCACQAPGHLSCWDLGRAQNSHPTESVPLWSSREPEPERLRPGKGTKAWACFGQFPCRAPWSLSQESTGAVSGANPVWPRHCEHSPHTRAIFACGAPSSGASLVAQAVERLPVMQETWVLSLGQEDPLEKEMATHSSILAWRIPWTEEPGRLQSTGSQKVGHD